MELRLYFPILFVTWLLSKSLYSVSYPISLSDIKFKQWLRTWLVRDSPMLYCFFRRVGNISRSDCWLRHVSVWLSVCLSVRMEQLSFHWTDFDGNLYLTFFRKSFKTQVLLKSDKNNGYRLVVTEIVYDPLVRGVSEVAP